MELKTIIGKEVLLEKLRKNRERYTKTRKTLIEVYRKKDEEYLKARAEYSKKIYEGTLTEDDEQPRPPSIPEDRTDTYDMYIEMIERHTIRTLEIDNTSFRSLYWDKWEFIKVHIRAMKVWADSDMSLMAALSSYGEAGTK